VHNNFATFDSDHSGGILDDELWDNLYLWDAEMPNEADFQRLFDAYDTNMNGYIDIDEYAPIVAQFLHSLPSAGDVTATA
jgi:Ca2+-binding EF-hand superfamily protein